MNRSTRKSQMHRIASLIVLLGLFTGVAESVLCFNCTNVLSKDDPCEEGEIHNMPHLECRKGKCIYYDVRQSKILFVYVIEIKKWVDRLLLNLQYL